MAAERNAASPMLEWGSRRVPVQSRAKILLIEAIMLERQCHSLLKPYDRLSQDAATDIFRPCGLEECPYRRPRGPRARSFAAIQGRRKAGLRQRTGYDLSDQSMGLRNRMSRSGSDAESAPIALRCDPALSPHSLHPT